MPELVPLLLLTAGIVLLGVAAQDRPVRVAARAPRNPPWDGLERRHCGGCDVLLVEDCHEWGYRHGAAVLWRRLRLCERCQDTIVRALALAGTDQAIPVVDCAACGRRRTSSPTPVLPAETVDALLARAAARWKEPLHGGD